MWLHFFQAFTLYRLLYLLLEVDSPVNIHLALDFHSCLNTFSIGLARLLIALVESMSDKFCFTPKDPLPIKNHQYCNTGEQAKMPISLATLVHMYETELPCCQIHRKPPFWEKHVQNLAQNKHFRTKWHERLKIDDSAKSVNARLARFMHTQHADFRKHLISDYYRNLSVFRLANYHSQIFPTTSTPNAH